MLTITRLFGFEGLYGQDAYKYAEYTQAMISFFETGIWPSDFIWPVGYPFFSAVLNLFLPLSLAMQLVSVFSLIGIGLLVKNIQSSLYPKVNKEFDVWGVVCLVILSPYFLRASVVAMSDLQCAFFITLALRQFTIYRVSSKSKSIIWFAIAGSLAVMTRYPAALIIVPLGVLFLVEMVKKGVLPIAQIIIAIIFILTISYPQLGLRKSGSLNFLNHSLLESWSLNNFFSNSFFSADGSSVYKLPNLLFVVSPFVHPGFITLGFPLLLSAFYNRKFLINSWRILLLIAIYLLFLAGIPTQNQRLFFIIFPLVVLAEISWFEFLINRIKYKRYLVSAAIICQLTLFVYAISKPLERVRMERGITNHLKTLDSKSIIYTMDLDLCFNYYGVENKVYNLYYTAYNDFVKGSYVLVNPKLFTEQWQQLNPGKNWERLKSENLELLQSFKNGWELYVIQ
ncbi:MAG: hypothetical protein KDC92_03445 [Bacteroidetes bacterium]|nr:hypothetical protein [Bacteroidota bacterium]